MTLNPRQTDKAVADLPYYLEHIQGLAPETDAYKARFAAEIKKLTAPFNNRAEVVVKQVTEHKKRSAAS